jgi:hypothetical protein
MSTHAILKSMAWPGLGRIASMVNLPHSSIFHTWFSPSTLEKINLKISKEISQTKILNFCM